MVVAYISISLLSAGCGKSADVSANRSAPAKAAERAFLWADLDNDGLPDGAELRAHDDRESFRRWFTTIAEMQYYKLSDAWNEDQRDCAGLIRFAWREALRRHDSQWFQRMGNEYKPVSPDIRAYTLDRSPLGEKLFRTDFGSFNEGDLENKFSDFADARTLKNYNTVPVGRDPRRALPGDLIFFHQPWVQKFPYHVMIFIGESRNTNEGANDWVVYHTGASPAGASPGDKGEVKKVRLSVLDHHPDKRWRPVGNNPNFLGFYRLKLLE